MSDKEHLSNTNTKIRKEKELPHKIGPDFGRHKDLNMPKMVKNRPSTGVYGSIKFSESKDQALK